MTNFVYKKILNYLWNNEICLKKINTLWPSRICSWTFNRWENKVDPWYDMIRHHENKYKQGPQRVADYPGSFDPMEWDVILKCLKVSLFVDKPVNVVKNVQTQSFFKMEQKRFFSEKIVLECGCKTRVSHYWWSVCTGCRDFVDSYQGM